MAIAMGSSMKFIGVNDVEMISTLTFIHSEAIAILQSKYPSASLDFLDRLEIDLSMRLGVAAGYAELNRITGSIKIKLHYRLFKEHPQELRNTYMHELAHILANTWYKVNCGHDARWRAIAMLLGDSGERCHNMKVAHYRKTVVRYVHKCSCKEWTLTRTRHNRYLNGTIYRCPDCKTRLEYARGPVAKE